MSLRGLTWLTLAGAAVSGAAIPPALFAGEPVRMLVTFLGLVSASILPTVSLAITSMSGTGRSVQKINELYDDVRQNTAALFRTLAYVAFVFAALLVFTMTPVVNLDTVVLGQAIYLPDAARRVVQLVVFASAVHAVSEAYRIPKTFRSVLAIKRDIAVYEARKHIREAAPGEAEIKQIFPKKEGFGKSVSLEQLGK
ncbi:hypothetical protein [Halodurantibacterium flavum]|uniref:Uncharacterized protein n=1 Tax=Halodurantibacterium flavum TaxID=1382802 RepID=A0ABW4S9J5_9RHOB